MTLPLDIIECILCIAPRVVNTSGIPGQRITQSLLNIIQPSRIVYRAIIPHLERNTRQLLAEGGLCLIKKWSDYGGHLSEVELAVSALLRNQVDVLKWLIEINRWNPRRFDGDDYCSDVNPTYAKAVANGSYAAVTWLAKNAPSRVLQALGRLSLDDGVLGDLIRTGGQEGVELATAWLARGLEVAEYEDDVLVAAAARNQIQVLDAWTKDMDPPRALRYSDMEAFRMAARSGDIHILEWWAQKGFPLSSVLAEDAFEEGQVPLLTWLVDRLDQDDRDFVTGDALIAASESGHLGVLQWWKASELEADWDPERDLEDMIEAAEQAGHVHVSSWLREQFEMESE